MCRSTTLDSHAVYASEPVVTLHRVPNADEVSEAIVVWSGKGDFAWPHRDEARLVARFGEERALDLMPQVKRLEEEFYESKAYTTEPDLAAVGRTASEQFRAS